MTQRSRVVAAVVGLLLLSVILSACGSAQVAQTWPGLTVTADTVYAISGVPQKVYILDAEKGTQKATFMPQIETKGKGVVYWSPVTIGGDQAFVSFSEEGQENARLYAFDPETGQELWHVQTKALIIPAPAYAGGVVYFGSSDGKLWAVDVETESLKPGFSFQAESAIWASPLVVGERVYIAAMDHHVYCLNGETGKVIWKTQVGGAMAAPPLLDNDILYVGAFDGKIHAIDANSGELIEDFDFQAENWIWSRSLMSGGQLYATSLDGKLYALEPSNGAVNAPYPYDSSTVSGKKDIFRAGPVEAGDFIVVATESGYVIAVENGQQQWFWPSGTPTGSVLTTPVAVGGTVYVILMDGQVQALDSETGTQRWMFTPPESD